MTTPRLNISISEKGIEKAEILYRPSQRSEVWQLCQEYIPWLLEKASRETETEAGS